MGIKRKYLAVMIVLVMSSCLQQQSEANYCVAVYDGDTFELESGDVVRLIGIGSPEHFEPGGDIAQDYLSSLILNKKVVLIQGYQEKDDYDRLLRYGYVDGICVNEEMIKKGYAEVRYISEASPHKEYYLQLEIEAEKKFVCPVCGQLLHERNLPDMQSIIYENLYDQGDVRIGTPKVRLYCDFEHYFDEEGSTMDNPHDLVGAVDAEFDQAGDCTGFVLVKILPADNAKIQDPGIAGE